MESRCPHRFEGFFALALAVDFSVCNGPPAPRSVLKSLGWGRPGRIWNLGRGVFIPFVYLSGPPPKNPPPYKPNQKPIGVLAQKNRLGVLRPGPRGGGVGLGGTPPPPPPLPRFFSCLV